MTLRGSLVGFLPEDKTQSLIGIGTRYLAKPFLKASNDGQFMKPLSHLSFSIIRKYFITSTFTLVSATCMLLLAS